MGDFYVYNAKTLGWTTDMTVTVSMIDATSNVDMMVIGTAKYDDATERMIFLRSN